MAGGLPTPEYFPFDSISAEALKPEAFQTSASGNSSSNGLFTWLRRLFGVSPETSHMEIPKYVSDPTDPSAVQLSVALQYGTSRGLLSLQTFVRAFTTSVFRPLNPETTTLLHVGNTDGWDKIAETLCNPGEFILTEEWTYPGAVSAAWPHHVRPFGIPMDGQGMRADSLEDILAKWMPEVRGAPRSVSYPRPYLTY
jgi:aromatic amino acid aminotransferase I / 2-aminoadipate transaminase